LTGHANNPTIVVDESEFAAMIRNSLRRKGPSSFLILAEPGDGSTRFRSSLEARLKSISDIALNVAKISSESLAPSKFPYSIQCLIGEGIRKPFERFKIRWFSLTFMQRASFIFAYLLFLALLHVCTVFFLACQSHTVGKLTLQDFCNIISFLSFSTLAILGTVLPMLLIVLWKSAWRALTDDEIVERRDTIIRMLKKNDYALLKRKFRRSFCRQLGPLIIILDSLDDMDNDFDQDFILKMARF